MKYLFVITLLFASLVGFSQESDSLLIRQWGINKVFGFDENVSHYVLKENTNPFSWGNNIEFKEDGTFVSYYSAKCGSDCFRNTFGDYAVLEGGLLQMRLNRVSVTGDCDHMDEKREEEPKLFKITYYADSVIVDLLSSND